MVPTETPASRLEDPGINCLVVYTIDGIACNSISSPFGFDDNHILFLLTDDDCNLATILHSVKEDLVSEDIEFLLVIAGCIGSSREAEQVDQCRPTNVVSNEFTRQLETDFLAATTQRTH
jgi:hypothetical protein